MHKNQVFPSFYEKDKLKDILGCPWMSVLLFVVLLKGAVCLLLI